MRTVGILTHCPGRNYGGTLQCYALQRVIDSLGFRSHVIDFRPPAPSLANRTTKQGIANIGWRLSTAACDFLDRTVIQSIQHATRERRHLDFMGKQMRFTPNIYRTSADFRSAPDGFDHYVVGSDVVWYPGGSDAFYLPEVPDGSNRIAYAASFGTSSVPDELAQPMGRSIQRFSHISVRENLGVDLVKTLANRDAEWVLDPTLLLSSAEWTEIARPLGHKKPYLLSYFLNETPYMRRLSTDIGRQLRLPVISIAGGNLEFQTSRKRTSEFITHCMNRRVRSIYNAGPSQFVGGFRHADAILTNSFHGMAFAVIFRKPFIAVLRNGISIRQTSLSDMLGLSKHLTTDGESPRPELDMNPDYDEIHSRLTSLKKHSIDFLRNALQLSGNTL